MGYLVFIYIWLLYIYTIYIMCIYAYIHIHTDIYIYVLLAPFIQVVVLGRYQKCKKSCNGDFRGLRTRKSSCGRNSEGTQAKRGQGLGQKLVEPERNVSAHWTVKLQCSSISWQVGGVGKRVVKTWQFLVGHAGNLKMNWKELSKITPFTPNPFCLNHACWTVLFLR